MSAHSFDVQAWQRRQMSVLEIIFDKAVEELGVAGTRLLSGSSPAVSESLSSVAQITLSPLRYGRGSDNGFLALVLGATTSNGPGRYVVSLRISGDEPTEALTRLIDRHPDIWRANYLNVGLWLRGDEGDEHLNMIEQLINRKSRNVTISGVILHSSSGQAVQAALMSIAVLYRSVLDELSDASKMARLSACLGQRLNSRPNYDRLFRP